MPLSKARQAEYQRERRKRLRGVIPNVIPKLTPRVIPKPLEIVQPSEPAIPLYNPSKHRAGDTVRINGKVVTIPELDADGHEIPW